VALFTLPFTWLAACGGDTDTGSRVSPSLTKIAQAAARSEDRVNVKDLASWLIEERGDFVLIDVRLPEDYERGMISRARNIPIAQLFTEQTLGGLPRDRKLIVYSNGSQNAAKAAVLLRLSGFNAHVLTGGYAAWHQQVLNPDIPLQASPSESPALAEQRAYACYFVGERSMAALPEGAEAEPFVPPVVVEIEEQDALPPPSANEGC
jgi:rhodanese-related sulfurtransferase